MEKQYYIYATNWIQIVAIAPWFKNYSFHYTHQIGQGLPERGSSSRSLASFH